jgi:hypothetical protein
MAGPRVRDLVWVQYPSRRLWLERLVLARVNRAHFVIITPELDMYTEKLSVPPLTGMHILGRSRDLPPGVRAQNTHRFQLSGRPGGFFREGEIDRMVLEARVLAEGEESFEDEEMGGAPEEQVGDLRTLRVKYDRSGKPYRNSVESVSMLEAVEFTGFVVEGPRTYKDFVEALTRKGNSPIAYHTRWVMETGVDKKSPGALAHELGCERIEIAHSYDQLQTPNLASFELLARWLPMIEHSVAPNPKKPDFQNQHLFLGTSSRGTTGGLTNSLAKHVASRAAEGAAVLKERRKAREERAWVTKK